MSGERVCAGCGRWITEQYVQALGRNWHPACFRCAACGRPIEEQFAEHDGAVYHPHCHQERFGLRCAACGGFIEGQYVKYEGQVYHPDCHRQQYGKRCAVCGESIEGQYMQTFWGEMYCARHATEYPECYVCQRPVCQRLTGGGKQYRDGRIVCMLCRKQAVPIYGDGFRRARAIYERRGLPALLRSVAQHHRWPRE